MASTPLTFLSLLLFFSLSSATGHQIVHTDIIHEACKASREPPKCQSSLSGSNKVPLNASVLQVIQSTLWVSSQNIQTGRKMVRDIMESSAGNKNRSDVAQTCLQLLRYSNYRMNLAGKALPLGHSKIKDARAWVSAALAYQYGCWSSLHKVNNTSPAVKTIDFFNSTLMPSTTNVLGMMLNYDVFGDKTGSWCPPKTERDGFWERGSDSAGSGSVRVVPLGLKVNVTVCKGGKESCDYQTVQQAINAAPNNPRLGKRFVVRIKTGVYEETIRIPLRKKNVVLLGDGMAKTIITGSMSVGLQGVSTYDTATVGVLGDGFMAKDLTIQNTAGPNANQAVAFRSDSDLSIIENCEFIGNQDTLYAHTLRQYYKSCRIQGNIDFIFGNSAAIFQDCHILVVPRLVNPEMGENNAVTAHGRLDPAESTGFVFQNCVINGTDAYMALYRRNPSVHRNFLGRPWKLYSRVVFIRCSLGALVEPDGWIPWSGDFALKTLFFGEFENTGPGSNTSERVSWSSQIPAGHINKYSVQNFIQGDQWIIASS